MTWLPIRGAIKRMREARKMEVAELAKLTGLSERTLWLYESRKAPKTMHADSVRRLTLALACASEQLAQWRAYRRTDAPEETDQEDPTLPPVGTLARRAEQEREIGAAGSITTASGTYVLLGPALFKRCSTACAIYKDQRFSVAGRVKEHRRMPDRAASALAVEIGHGALFMLTRNVAKGVPFYATVYTCSIEQTQHLLDRADDRKRVTVIVRVVVKPPENDWKGFFIFEKKQKKPTPHHFAFVVEEIASINNPMD